MQKMARQDSIDAWRHHMQQTMVRKPKYIIIDEAHSYGAPSYRKMRDLFPDAKLIGLSATPFRSNKYSFSCFEKVTYTRSMGDLIALGFLTTPKTEQVSIPEDMDNHGGRIALSYRIWKERESKRGLVTVVYLPTVDLAKSALASFTQQKGVRCGYLDGSSTLRETRKVLGAAREGKYDVLINCKKLETGVDIPNIGSVIMPYPVDSVVAYIQRVGRALRLFPGKEYAMIYLCGDAPSIAKGDWIDVHNRAMETREPKPSESLKEELSEGGPDKPRLEWTKEAIKACEILEQKDMVNLSKFLAFKRFPKKYDIFIGRILKHGAPTEGYDNSPASQIQREILVNRFKFTESRARSLTKREASTFINGFKSYMDTDPFIFRDGPHMGKHPSELHPLTRKHCHGDTKKRLQAWWKAGRPMRREE
jgi:superfamily II DNA or RNA helicase